MVVHDIEMTQSTGVPNATFNSVPRATFPDALTRQLDMAASPPRVLFATNR
jgi:hypothetical protein